MENERSSDELLHVAMFPWFAFGHINPFIHLSNKLSSHGIKISFLSATGNIPRIKQTLNQSCNTQIIPLHIPSVEGLPPGYENTSNMTDGSMPELLKLALDKMEPQIRTLLADLKPHVVLFDFAHHWLPNLASDLGIKSVFFCIFSTIGWSYICAPSRIKTTIKEEPPVSLKATTKIEIPTVEEFKKAPKGYLQPSLSCKTFVAQNLLYAFKSCYGGLPVIMRCNLGIQGCDAIALKSCNEMEDPYIESIKSQLGKPVLLTGLALPESSSSPLEPKFAKWLGKFPPKSVVFCSFGSESFLNEDQIKELALGLELTGLPFLLVLNLLESSEPALPSGFMERASDRGMVHTGWVQQSQILAHESVGCYVSHAGSASLVEALVGDCQLVFLPLKDDQFFTTKLFSVDLKAGVEVNRRDEDGHFGKSDILEAVKTVMVEVDKEPGITIRANQRKWRDFVMNKEIQDKYVFELARDLKALALKDH